jgi:hypothetical protein
MSEVKCDFESQGFGTWGCVVCGRQVLYKPMLSHSMICKQDLISDATLDEDNGEDNGTR